MSRIGLGRHGLIEENAGDPLDGLVNLFDVGMILAVAFLIAGLALTLNAKSGKLVSRKAAAGAVRVRPSTARARRASGRGEPVGQVYRLADGRLVYVKEDGRR
ncbi:MAG: DUF2149 domain-containing protein [Solirubrobacterales bacterium]